LEPREVAVKLKTHRQSTTIEAAFLRAWEMVFGLNDRPMAQLRFALPDRQFRFDYAWPSRRVAVELEGGIFMRNRNKGHASPKELLASIEKNNAAMMRGWRVLRYSTVDLRKRPVQVVEEVAELLRRSRLWSQEQKTLALGEP
jgi:very-short-patch-repair endonuclease